MQHLWELFLSSPAAVLGSARVLLDRARGGFTWVLCVSFGFPFQNVIVNLLFKKKRMILLLLSEGLLNVFE